VRTKTEIQNLEKNQTKNGNILIYRVREKQFEETLDYLFDIVHSNVMNLIKIDEEKKFLLLQRQRGRVGCMLGRDMKLSEKEQRKAARENTEKKRKEKKTKF
jgi:adenylate/nucleoside-diphosphate kinase